MPEVLSKSDARKTFSYARGEGRPMADVIAEARARRK